ncbi:MAG: hypothetical protein NZ898_16380 [Myxococcota bacterium]|nr:hypothetical protein [Myxococcota bacterium]
MRRRWVVRFAMGTGALAGLFALLAIPLPEEQVVMGAGARPFAWNMDARWEELERRFVAARRAGCDAPVRERLDAAFRALHGRLDELEEAVRASPPEPDDARFEAFEVDFFETAASMGGCLDRLDALLAVHGRLRVLLEELERRWDPGERAVRERLYRLRYGGRTALEALLVQMPPDRMPALQRVLEPSCRGPSTVVRGVRVCSGDVLVSRGGAPTSALIARGNDFPGNFSHVALVHVDAAGRARAIEALIERGLVVTEAADYLADEKLRLMLLRLHPDEARADASTDLAHAAADDALREAREREVPYDFAMDHADPSAYFCSEVALWAYARRGVRLWRGLSTMSSPGLVHWLSSLGVRHFETLAPADLEYDPALVVVAEWRAPRALQREQRHNAVIDALLEEADRGATLDFPPWKLPLARLARAWSALARSLGETGPIPEGMRAPVALRVEMLRARHAEIERAMTPAVERFARERGYVPPYWQLVRMAREAAAATADPR